LIERRKTAGELSLKAASDSTDYDVNEVGQALAENEKIAKELWDVVQRHNPIFNEDEYCIGYVIAGDPLLSNLRRRKFFAMLYLPSPRPNQTVFLYNKRWDRFTKRLWTLPKPETMAILSETPYSQLALKWHDMKRWSDWFYQPDFWKKIRKQHAINLLSEKEFLEAHREELVKAGCKYVGSLGPDTLNFANVAAQKIIHPKIVSLPEKSFNV
jgi:hypothetical protein